MNSFGNASRLRPPRSKFSTLFECAIACVMKMVDTAIATENVAVLIGMVGKWDGNEECGEEVGG